MSFDFSWVPEYFPLFLHAAVVTLELLGAALVISLVLGLLSGQALTSPRAWIRVPVRLYVDFFRLTPLLLQIVVIFFLVPTATGVEVSAFVSGVIALSLNYAAFFSEIFKAGVTSIERGQWEASQAIGMTNLQVLRRIVYPQAIRRMLPPVGNMVVSLTKDTSLVSVIGVAELLNVSQSVGSQTFRNIEVLLFISVFYLVINIPLALLATGMHRRSLAGA